jgi:heat shock protein HslJ
MKKLLFILGGLVVLYLIVLAIPKPAPVVESPAVDLSGEPTNFVQEGVLVFPEPSQGQGAPYLSYKSSPSAPTTTVKLTLDEQSICGGNNGSLPCMAMSIQFSTAFGGKRAIVEGVEREARITVRRLRILDDGEVGLTAGQTVNVTGKVLKIDLVPMTYDGPALITLKSQSGTTFTIAVPARIALCAAYKANNIGDVSLIKVGDEFEVRGKVSENGSIIPCESADHYLRPTPLVVQGFEGEADPSRMTLGMKTWTWISAQYNDGRKITPKVAGKFTLNFTQNGGRFSVGTDCNSGGGSYSLASDNTIVMSDMMSTQMFCEGSQEGEFFKLLSEVQKYHFTSKGELILDLKSNSGSVVFK